MFETFPENVKLKCSPQSAPFFMVRVVTRGLYPKLVGKTVSKNLETITSVGCENFGIEGTFSYYLPTYLVMDIQLIDFNFLQL